MSAEKPGKVLIADNDADVLLALEWTLESEGYDTLLALNDEEAMRILTQDACDLVVLDDYLSEKDSGQILVDFRHAGIRPLVVITYHHFPSLDTRYSLESLGASAFVSKQAPSELVHIVRYLLEPHTRSHDVLSRMT
jgi:DNA-binding NtrC family response regulator